MPWGQPVLRMLCYAGHVPSAVISAMSLIGCGKTLSLLCSALAWQSVQKQRRIDAEGQRAAAPQRPHAGVVPSQGDNKGCEGGRKTAAVALDATPCCTADAQQEQQCCDPGSSSSCSSESSDAEVPSSSQQPHHEPLMVVPRIYYATRTHSQIAQVCGIFLSTMAVSVTAACSLCVLCVLCMPCARHRHLANDTCTAHALPCQVVRELKRTGYTPRMAVLVRAGALGNCLPACLPAWR